MTQTPHDGTWWWREGQVLVAARRRWRDACCERVARRPEEGTATGARVVVSMKPWDPCVLGEQRPGECVFGTEGGGD